MIRGLPIRLITGRSMGRETKILLGFLGLLAGVFVGVLSSKLLVPRPPAGTGPDIRSEAAVTTAQERVEPPSPPPAAESRFSRFAAAPPVEGPEATDDGVRPASWQRADSEVAHPADTAPPPPMPPRDEPLGLRARDPVAPPPAPRPAPVAGDYLVQSGDSWWGVAERAYGDGRLYRALFAWNRSRNPRISLAPGTRLDVPPLDRLAAAWPRLLPRGPR